MLASTALSAVGVSDADQVVEKALESGAAYEKCLVWLGAQGADLGVLEFGEWGSAAVVRDVVAERSGFVGAVDARGVGQLILDLGGGRKSKSDVIDHSVGVEMAVEVGDELSAGDLIGRVYASSEADGEMGDQVLRGAVSVVEAAVDRRAVVLR